MSDYRKGDRVRIVKMVTDERLFWHPDMTKNIGKIGVVKTVAVDRVRVVIDGKREDGWYYLLDSLEPEYNIGWGDIVTSQTPQTPDDINKPAHYNAGGIECITAIEAALTPDEFRGYLKGNMIKYAWRERYKDGAKSVRKAAWYAERLAKFLDSIVTKC